MDFSDNQRQLQAAYADRRTVKARRMASLHQARERTAYHDPRQWRSTQLPTAALLVGKRMAASRYASPTSSNAKARPDATAAMRRTFIPKQQSIQKRLPTSKTVRFAAPSPLSMFPVAKDTTITDVWASPLVEKQAAWLFAEAGDELGLGRDDALGRDFRRFEGGGLFTTLGGEKEAAMRASRAFLMTPNSGVRDEGYAIVPRSELRELASLEGNLRKERRSFVQDCEHLVAQKAMLPDQRYSLSEPSPVATFVLVATCDREIKRCEATVQAMFAARRREAAKERSARPWRRTIDSDLSPLGGGLSGKLRPETDLVMAKLAVKTGSWGSYLERRTWHRRVAETEAMAFEDGYCRCAWRATDARSQRADYQTYVALVARYGVPFGEVEFNALGNRAGSTFRELCDSAAIKWQKMWWFYAPVYRLRRARASSLIQRRWRGVACRRTWAPILHLLHQNGRQRPLRMALGHWHRCILRTLKARALVFSIKNHKVKRLLKAWRGLVGDALASHVVDTMIDAFADEKIGQHVRRYFGDYVKSTGLRFEMLANDGTEKCIEPIVDATVEGIIESFCAFEELPAWMDTNWFLQKCSYENHLLLVRSGVLPPDLFAESKRDYLWARAACEIQRAGRGRVGRDRVRQKLARTYRKRWDGRRFYYVNLKTDERLDARPRLIGMLFPRSVF